MLSESASSQPRPTLCDPVDCIRQAPLSMGFSRQEYCSGMPFPSPGGLPNPGIKFGSPALQADSFSSEPPGKPQYGSQTSRIRYQDSIARISDLVSSELHIWFQLIRGQNVQRISSSRMFMQDTVVGN